MPTEFSPSRPEGGRQPFERTPTDGAVRLANRTGLDLQDILSVAKEIAKALSAFRAPPGFTSESALLEPVLTSDMVKALGAASLSEYFQKTPHLREIPEVTPEPALRALPRGTDALREALTAVNRRLNQIQKSSRRSDLGMESEKSYLTASKVALNRASGLVPRLKELVEQWPRDIRSLYQESKALSDAVNHLLKSPNDLYEDSNVSDGVALTSLTSDLKADLNDHKRILKHRLSWWATLKDFIDEVESLFSALSLDEDDRAWSPLMARLTTRLNTLAEDHRELIRKQADSLKRVSRSRDKLLAAEKEISGEYETVRRHRGELLSDQIRMLLRSVLMRRRELATGYQILPGLVGRPAFLEKAFLYSAVTLGRVQAMAEEMQISLARFNGRRSSTCDIRSMAQEILSAPDRSTEYRQYLDRARKWMVSLANLVKRKTAEANQLQASTAQNQYGEPDLAISRSDDDLDRQLRAVESEQRSLDDSLLEAKNDLVTTGRHKFEIIKCLQKARDGMARSQAKRKSLEGELKEVTAELAAVKRRHLRLTEYYKRDRQLLKEAELKYKNLTEARLVDRKTAKDFLDLKAQLTSAKEAHKASINALDEERRDLFTAQVRLNNEIDELKGREAGLTVELSGRQEELKEATRIRNQLGNVITEYRAQLDRLTIAHNALKASWRRRGRLLAEGEAEREALQGALDRQKQNLISLVTKRQELMAELGEFRLKLDNLSQEKSSLLEELDRVRREASSRAESTGQLERERQALYEELERVRSEAASATSEAHRLGSELEDRHKEIDDDLIPFIRLLAMTVWQSQSYMEQVRADNEAALDNQRKEFQAREASVRIEGATKEIDYLELLSVRDKQIGDLRNERDALKEDLESIRINSVGSDEELVKRSWLCHQLSVAFTTMNLRSERLKRGLKDFRTKARSQKEESEKIKAELESLIQSQAQALADHKSYLATLVPIVGYFLDRGSDFWAAEGREDARDAALFFMTRENAKLAKELDDIKVERQGLFADRRNLSTVFESMRRKLEDLKPLVEFLVVKFAQTTSQLAVVIGERDSLRRDVETLSMALTSSSFSDNGTTTELLTDGNDQSQAPERARFEVARLSAENRSLTEAVRRGIEELERHRSGLRILEGEKKELTSSLEDREKLLSSARQTCSKLEKDREKLLSSIERQALDLNLAKTEASRLAQERDQLKSEAKKRAEEFGALQSRLTEMQNHKPQSDGRLEAAWAAMTYLSSKAGDAMGNLQNKLDRQARELESTASELRTKEAEIKRLEERQDSLSLMFWTMLSLTIEGQGPNSEALVSSEENEISDSSLALEPAPAPDIVIAHGKQGSMASGFKAKNDSDALGLAQSPTDGFLPNQISEPDISALDDGGETLSQEENSTIDLDDLDSSVTTEASSSNAASGSNAASSSAASGSSLEANEAHESNESNEAHKSNEANTQSDGDQKGGLGGTFLTDLRKSARRGILSLFLTGGLVFLLPESLGAIADKNETLDLGGPQTPMVLDTPKVSQQSAPPTRWGSRYLGRTLDLGALDLSAHSLSSQKSKLSDPTSQKSFGQKIDLEGQGVSLGSSLGSSVGSLKGSFQGPLNGSLKAVSTFPKPPVAGSPGAFRPYFMISELNISDDSSKNVANKSGNLEGSLQGTLQSSLIGSLDDPLDQKNAASAAPKAQGPLKTISSLTEPSPLEEVIRQKVSLQAERYNLPPDCWVRLIQRAYGPETTISLSELDGDMAPIKLLAPHMAAFSQALARCNQISHLYPTILKTAASFDYEEGPYWDRLFACFLEKTLSEREAVLGLACRLERKPSLRLAIKPEYIGQFKPIEVFENLGPDRAVDFLTSQIRSEWPGLRSPKRHIPRGHEPKRLASDLIVSAKLFGLPRTLVVVVAHDNFKSSSIWPDTLAVHQRAKVLTSQICLNLQAWASDKPFMCELENMASRQLRGRERPASVLQEYLAFLNYLNCNLNPVRSLFGPPAPSSNLA